MKKLLILIILFNSIFLNAQNVQEIIIGLKKDLKTSPDDKKLATIYSDLTWYYLESNMDSAEIYGKKNILLCEKINDSKLLAQSYSDLGALYLRRENFKESKLNYLKAYTIRKKNNDRDGLAKININLGSIYGSQQDYFNATRSYLEAIKYFENRKKDTIVSLTKANLALIFQKTKNYPKALKYINEAIKIEEKNKMNNGLCNAYITLGNIYLETKDTLNGIKFYNKSYENCKLCNDKLGISTVYQLLGSLSLDKGNKNESNIFYKKSNDILKVLNSEMEIESSKLYTTQELINEKHFDKAYEILTKIKLFFIERNSNEYLLTTYKQLIYIFNNQKNSDSSICYFDRFNLLREKLQRNSILKSTAELETKYQTAKKEKLILEQEALSKQKNIWLIIISSFAAIGLILYNQQRIKSKQQGVQAMLEKELLQEQSNFKIQEQRLDISRELHDSVGSQLTFIISILDNLKSAPVKLDNIIEKKIDNLSGYANNSISELRDTIWALNTENLTIKELETRILNFIKDAGESIESIDFDFKNNIKNNAQLTSKQGINIFRVLQESVNNAVKYASPSKITIEMNEIEKQLTMQIQDNGNGFNYQEKKKKSYGLTNMKNRIEEINGNFDLSSNDDGTIINIKIPLEK